jgi:hypothetical protein
MPRLQPYLLSSSLPGCTGYLEHPFINSPFASAQFSLSQIGERSEDKGGRQGFDPPQNTFLERMQAQTDPLFNRGTYREHERNLFFIK